MGRNFLALRLTPAAADVAAPIERFTGQLTQEADPEHLSGVLRMAVRGTRRTCAEEALY